MKKLISVIMILVLALTTSSAMAYGVLQKGSKGEAVAALQNRLNELNYDAGVADGIYGNGTAAAVSEFQKKNDLEATGIADEETQEVLFSYNAIATVIYEALDWKGVSRNPDDFRGRDVKFEGKVLQVIEDYVYTEGGGKYISRGNYGLRVATKGGYDNVVFVVVPEYKVEGGRILEDDILTIYGYYNGIYEYTTVLGVSQSVPQIMSDSVIIK